MSAALQQKRIDELEAKVAEALKLAAAAQKALDEAEARREQAEARARARRGRRSSSYGDEAAPRRRRR